MAILAWFFGDWPRSCLASATRQLIVLHRGAPGTHPLEHRSNRVKLRTRCSFEARGAPRVALGGPLLPGGCTSAAMPCIGGLWLGSACRDGDGRRDERPAVGRAQDSEPPVERFQPVPQALEDQSPWGKRRRGRRRETRRGASRRRGRGGADLSVLRDSLGWRPDQRSVSGEIRGPSAGSFARFRVAWPPLLSADSAAMTTK